MEKIMFALIFLNFVHWAADYTHLSNAWMLSAKRFGYPLFPIFCHALVHAWYQFCFLIVVTNSTTATTLALFQLITHFGIDVLKGRMNGWFPALLSPANPYHWYVFGFDQFLHQLVIILIAFNI